MLRALLAIRSGERRDTWTAFAVLFGFVASHTVLETARDALFLARVPATRLPWVYLAIAAVSLFVGRAQDGLGSRMPARRALTIWTVVASAGTLGFWAMPRSLGPAVFYALYVWSGLLASLAVGSLWALLGELFSVTQAKRLYGIIGTGSVLGAIAGSSAASAIARIAPTDRLLLISAVGFAITAGLPRFFRQVETPAAETGDTPTASSGIVDDTRFVARHPYAARVALLLITSAACLTFADYVFKSTAAAHVRAGELGAFFATVALVLNIASLVAQLALVPWVLRRFDLAVALAILPVLLALGGVGVAAGLGLAAALFVRGADGTLRYSLYRTSTELLFIPLGDEARRRVKGLLDMAGGRGGQAVASVAILLAAAMGLPGSVLAALLALLGAAWAFLALDLRPHYLDIFRRHLDEGKIASTAFPELDVASLETLVAALDSEDEAEVLAALDVLEREDKVRLVPALILYHPSEEVVVRALSLFATAARKNIAHVLDRLFEHPAPRVRAAALATRSMLRHDAKLLNLRLSMEDSPEVRATIVVHLIAAGDIIGSEAKDRLDDIVRRGTIATKIALASAVAFRERPGFDDVLTALAASAEPDVRIASANAMLRLRSPALLPALIALLADERTRKTVQRGLLGFGETGLAALGAALGDRDLSQAVRAEVPRVIAQFDAEPAAALLLERLAAERDGMIRYRIVRALESISAREPTVALDRTTLDAAIASHVARAYRYLDRRLTLELGAADLPGRATPGHAIIVRLLKDKERQTIDRLFRLFALAFPQEDFTQIYRGLGSNEPKRRASSIELIENLIEPPLRAAVVGLVDELPDRERLQAAPPFHRPQRLSYEALLDQMLTSESESLQDMTAFHIGELGLVAFRGRIADLSARVGPRLDLSRALERLGTQGGPKKEAPAC